MLATEWNQVEPTTWEFALREGVTFQDGTPMDAEAVAGALNHLLEVKTPGAGVQPRRHRRRWRRPMSRPCRSPPRSRTRWCRSGSPTRTAGSWLRRPIEGDTDRHPGHLHRSVHGDRGGAAAVAGAQGQRELLGWRRRPRHRRGAFRRRRCRPGHPAPDRRGRRSPRASRWPTWPRWRVTPTSRSSSSSSRARP